MNVCVWMSEVVISGVCAKAFLQSLDKLPCTGVRVNLRASIRDANPYGLISTWLILSSYKCIEISVSPLAPLPGRRLKTG